MSDSIDESSEVKDYYEIISNEDCRECGERFLENSIGEMECQGCGLINGQALDTGKEWRVFSDGSGSENERTGMAPTWMLHDKGLTTEIDWRNRDANGGRISGDFAKRLRRIRTQHKRTRIRNSTERNLVTALSELNRLASVMNLPQPIREEAAFIYRRAVEAKLVRGRSIEGVVAASLYAACRMRGNPRTLDEVGAASRTGRKEIGRTFRAIKMELQMQVAPASPEGYIPRFCADLQLPANVQGHATMILGRIDHSSMMAGRGPTGIAAAAVYLASRMSESKRTQREVSQAAGVTEVTIRNRYREICEALDLDPEDPGNLE
jgi:transcription initiation factor TFIIB